MKDDATAEHLRGLFQLRPAVRREEERGVVFGLTRGGAFERVVEEVLDGEDRERAGRVAEVRVLQLVCRGPRREHARLRVVVGEEARGVAVQEYEVAVG